MSKPKRTVRLEHGHNNQEVYRNDNYFEELNQSDKRINVSKNHCPKGYTMSANAVCQKNNHTMGRSDCCQEAQEQWTDCFSTEYTTSNQCSRPGCQCASIPAYQVNPNVGGNSGNWFWNDVTEEYGFEMSEIAIGQPYWVYQCQCHPTPSAGYTLADCCYGGSSYGPGAPGTGQGFGTGRYRKGGKVRGRKR